MRPVSISQTGSGAGITNSSPVVMDYRISPFTVGIAFTTTGATTVFKVQYSLDDPQATYATSYNVNGNWFDHASLVTMTAAASGSQSFPVRAIRLQASAVGTDTGTLKIVQSGN